MDDMHFVIPNQDVQSTKGHTTLHKIVAVYHGMDMAVCEEV